MMRSIMDFNDTYWWELLVRLCALRRVSKEETEAADLLERVIGELGFKAQRHGNNVWSMHPDYDPSRKTLLLNAHIDTVAPTAEQELLRQQIAADIPTAVRSGRLEARGANDDGGSLVALLAVFASLSHKASLHTRVPYNIIYLASAEEEISGRGGIESVLPLLPHIDAAIVGEPTQMQPAVAERGLMVVDAVAHGVAGHAARNEGDNAIIHAMRDIEVLQHSENFFPKISGLLGAVKTSVTIIQGGSKHNVIPDRCQFTIDVRTNELYSNEEALAVLRQHLSSELTPRSTRLGSSRIDANHPLVTRAIELGCAPFGSPTLSDQALMPWPSLKIGPGDSSRSHTANEYLLREELEEGIELLRKIIL